MANLRTFSLPACDAVHKALPRHVPRPTDHFALGPVADMIDAFAALSPNNETMNGASSRWAGGVPRDRLVEMTRSGDLTAVPESDALLERFEALVPAPSARRAIRDDVAGSIANVPAYLSGSPLAMRRKVRDENEFAPIAVVVDLTSSAMISADAIRKRGVAVLALVRALSARRPIELWAGCGLDADSRKNALWAFAQLDTAPLDLARAAHFLTHPGVPRAMFYGYGEEHNGFLGGWPYSNPDVSRKNFHAIVARAFPHVQDVIAVPHIYGTDKAINEPVEWIREHLRVLGADDLDADAAA
jgi:hypothetical protein